MYSLRSICGVAMKNEKEWFGYLEQIETKEIHK